VQTNILKSSASDAKAVSATSSSTSKASGHTLAPFKLKTPTFSCKVQQDFQNFYDQFTDIVNSYKDCYSDSDK